MPTMSYINLGQAPLPLETVYALTGGAPDMLAVDFVNNRALRRDSVTPANNFNGALSLTGITDTHADTINADDAAGAYSAFAANALVRTSRGLQTSPTRTNSIRNNSMMGAVAGSPGTLPTNWISGSSNGLTREIVGTGVAGGLPYVDIRYAGVTTGGTFINIGFETITGAPVANGQTLTQSGVLSIVAGSLANTSLRWRASLYTAAPTYLDEASSQTLSLTTSPQRVAQTFTVNNASAERLFPYLQIGYAGPGAAIDITLRIAAPQLELGAFASPPIITTGAAATVAGNQQVIAGLGTQLAGGVYGFVQFTPRGDLQSGVPFHISDGTVFNRALLTLSSGSLRIYCDSVGAFQGNPLLGALVSGTTYTVAFAVGPNFLTGRVVGMAPVTADETVDYPTLNQLAFGGRGYSNDANTYQNTRLLALWYGQPDAAKFDAVYAKAVQAHALAA